MPWCPKCKSEYREGFTVCAECGSKLVEEEPLAESGGRDSSGEIAWKENVDSNVIVETKDDQWYVGT